MNDPYQAIYEATRAALQPGVDLSQVFYNALRDQFERNMLGPSGFSQAFESAAFEALQLALPPEADLRDAIEEGVYRAMRDFLLATMPPQP